MSYNNADQAFVLPSYGLDDSQKLSFLQGQQQLNEQRQQRLYEQKQRDEGRNLNTIEGDLDFSKYQTGEQAIDNYAQGEIQKIQNEALKSHIDDDPATLEGWIQNQIQPLAKWHTMTKDAYTQVDNQLKDYNKTYPNIDYNKARGIVLNQFQNDFINPDGTRKNTDQIQQSDYNSMMQSPDFLGQVNNDTSAFDKFFYDIPKVTVGDKQYTNKQGHVQSYAWSGLMPDGVGEIQSDADNKPTAIQLRGEVIPSVTDAQGNPMKTIPQDIAARLRGNPQAYAAALGKWQQAKPSIEQSYTQKTGQPLTTDVERMLMGSYLYNQANQLIAHPLKTEEIQKEPKITNVTNVNVPKDISVHDVYGEVANQANASPNEHNSVQFNKLSSTAQGVILDQVNKVAAKDVDENGAQRKFTNADIFIRKDNGGNLSVYRADNGQLIMPLNQTDLNLSTNKNQKQQQIILHNQNNNSQPISTKKKIEGF